MFQYSFFQPTQNTRKQSIQSGFGVFAIPVSWLVDHSLHIIRNYTRNILNSLLKLADLTTKVEAHGLLSSNNDERPADILITLPSGKRECLDVTCVTFSEKDSFAKREDVKLKKYASSCERNNLLFTPLVFNNLGELSDNFKEFIQTKLARGLGDKLDLSTPEASAYAIRRIQFLIVKLTSLAMRDSLSNDLA